MNRIFLLLKKYWLPILAFIISFAMFYPSLSGFFTHDDFYFLKISRVDSIGGFLNFFNPANDTNGIGVYRPLTLRVFYFLGSTIFNLNPLGLRIISFITFYLNVILVGYLAKLLTRNDKVSALSLFLYATSVTHFGQLYYIGAYQELFITFVFLSSIICFIKFPGNFLYSFIFFLIALMAKETAVMIPTAIVCVYFYLKSERRIKTSFKKVALSLLPFVSLLILYLYLHFFHFGTIEGDSYIWNFSITKAVNTTFWYFLWSLNLPEMLVDFVGPGVRLNPNLLKYWSNQIIPIFILFFIQIAIIFFAILKSKILNLKSIIFFSFSWFILTLLPVIFLPLHKFTYYLTLPLFGIVLLLSYIFINLKSKVYIVFCVVWVALSFFTLQLTKETNWITQGIQVSKRVHTYLEVNKQDLSGKKITFVDEPEDELLPWSPTSTLKIVLADNNFFEVFYPGVFAGVSYSGTGDVQIGSRQFLGY